MSTTQVDVRQRHRASWLAAVVVAAAALVALGAWALVDRPAEPGGDTGKVFDELTQAVTAGDEAAVSRLYASDAVFLTAHGDRRVGQKAIVATVMAPSAIGVRIERIAPVTTAGDLAATFLGYSGSVAGTKLTVLQLRDGKIVRHWDFESGTTPPLDNAVWP